MNESIKNNNYKINIIMNQKMFISHSSAQKTYVEKLVKLIGTNYLT